MTPVPVVVVTSLSTSQKATLVNTNDTQADALQRAQQVTDTVFAGFERFRSYYNPQGNARNVFPGEPGV